MCVRADSAMVRGACVSVEAMPAAREILIVPSTVCADVRV